MRPDVYIPADVETDGPVPGRHSMLSFGLSVAARYNGRRLDRADPQAETFYRELRPAFNEVDQQALAVSGLDHATLMVEGSDLTDAMSATTAWVRRVARGDRPVMLAFPLAFDGYGSSGISFTSAPRDRRSRSRPAWISRRSFERVRARPLGAPARTSFHRSFARRGSTLTTHSTTPSNKRAVRPAVGSTALRTKAAGVRRGREAMRRAGATTAPRVHLNADHARLRARLGRPPR